MIENRPESPIIFGSERVMMAWNLSSRMDLRDLMAPKEGTAREKLSAELKMSINPAYLS
jgi:hypothetical protein